MEGAPKGGGCGRIEGGPKGWGPWREKETGKQRGTLEGGGGPWMVEISAWREEGAPEGGEGPGGQRGSLEGRGPVQSVDGGPQKGERDPRRWSPRGRRKLEGRGWPWRVEGIPESRGGAPKGGGLDLGPQETPQGQVDMETPGSSLLCNPAEPLPQDPPPPFSCPQDPPWQSAPQGQEGP